MKSPSKIHPCPIIDALFEIRFQPEIDGNAVFGILYNQFKNNYSDVEVLPITNIPEQIRKSDSNFRYKPHYKISNKDYLIQIGPEVFSIAAFPNYLGWDKFSNEISKSVEVLKGSGIITTINRMGLRYINFFDNNIFEHLNMDVSICNSPIPYQNTVIRTELTTEPFKSVLQIANSVEINSKVGSVIDIDTSINVLDSDFYSKQPSLTNQAHNIEKELFFKLLKSDFINTLNPEF